MNKHRRIIADIEANAVNNVTKIWCIVAKDLDSGEIFKFAPKKKIVCPTCSGTGLTYCEESKGDTLCPLCKGRCVYYPGAHEEWQEAFLKFTKEVKHWYGHNFLGYDVYWINKILGANIKVKDVTDTLVLSRLFRPVSPTKDRINDPSVIDNRLGGHSLGAWGDRLGFHKIDFHEFDQFSEPQLKYCIRDVEVNEKILEVLEKERVGFSDLCISIEHNTAWILREQERSGFYLDQEAARKLRDDTGILLEEMEENLRNLFPPKKKVIRNWKPSFVDEPVYEEYEHTFKSGAKRGQKTMRRRAVKGSDGYQLKERKLSKTSEKIFQNWLHEEVGDGSYNLYVMQEFNPGSPQQIGERLIDLGWKPKKFTPTGNPSTDKDTLLTVLSEMGDTYDEVKYLADYNIVADRHQKANKWLCLVEEDGRVHGRINPIGAGNHRCSHFDDNMANIAAVQVRTKDETDFIKETKKHPSEVEKFTPFESKGFVFVSYNEAKKEVDIALTGREGVYGWESRSCWSVPPGKVLIGSDAAGIQLRALAHYMGDEEYTRKLLEDDIHTVNQHAAGLPTRKKAKTFIYSFLLGAGDEKTGDLIGIEDTEIDSLIYWAHNEPPPYGPYKNNSLLKYIKRRLRREGRPVLRKTVAKIAKGNQIKKKFLERTPALKRLKEVDIPKAVEQGYLVGLDGRKLWIPNEHLALSLYLQGFEAVVMKTSMILWHREAQRLKIPYKQTAMVHDEVCVETDPEYGDTLGKLIAESYGRAGEILGSRCPLDGEYAIGTRWSEVH